MRKESDKGGQSRVFYSFISQTEFIERIQNQEERESDGTIPLHNYLYFQVTYAR
jgi:hypothetical protein